MLKVRPGPRRDGQRKCVSGLAFETSAGNRENPVSRVLTTDAARRSDAISIARVICILGVVYVHAWTGLNGHDLESLRGTAQDRSEEHTSELPSLMRISYAVFCLKNKNHNIIYTRPSCII